MDDLTKDSWDYRDQQVGYNSVSQLSNVPITKYLVKVLKSRGFAVEELPRTDPNGVDELSIVGKSGRGKGGLTIAQVHTVDEWTGLRRLRRGVDV